MHRDHSTTDRRRFLLLAGATTAGAVGLAGCSDGEGEDGNGGVDDPEDHDDAEGDDPDTTDRDDEAGNTTDEENETDG